MKVAPSVAMLGGLALLALFIVDSRINEGNQALATRAIAANKAWREHVARDRQASDANHQRQAVMLRGMVTALDMADQYRDSVSKADTLPPPDSSNPVAVHWNVLYTFALIRGDSLASALDQSQSAMLLARADASRAWRLVAEGREASLLSDEALKARQCRILFVPCPSRLVVGVAGVAVGALVVGLVKSK